MTTQSRYARPAGEVEWGVSATFDTTFRWEYSDGRDALLKLYEKGKALQWNTNTRIDWSLDLDPENPQEMPDEAVPIFGSDVWNKLTGREKATVRRHLQAWQLSQFLHGEQGYPQLTQKERDEREEFAVQACYLMRDRFLAHEVWETIGLPVEACVRYVDESRELRAFRSRLFTRIVPTIREIGLWGPKIRAAYEDMGIIGFADVDGEALSRQDEQVAEEMDRLRGR